MKNEINPNLKCCGDCLAQEGEIHKIGCDMERCTKCGKQKICCDCGYEIEREPFFEDCYCCKRCGKKMPELKMRSKDEWEFICGVTYPRDCILCDKCMNKIKMFRDLK